MILFDFITQDELDELPDDAPSAFIQFVAIAQRRLADYIRQLDRGDDETNWRARQEAEHSFVNIVIAVAKRYEIEPFSKMDVPTFNQVQNNDAYSNFKLELDHFTAQVVVGNTIRGKRDSVAVSEKTKASIRTYLSALRDAIDKADLSDARREALLKKLVEFEAELEKRRLSLLALTRLTLAIAVIPGGVWQSGEIAMKLVSNVIQAVGEAKAAEDEARALEAPAPVKALPPSPPRKAPETTVLDDDIPF